MVPFLKWPGGKRWLAPQITAAIEGLQWGTYREPFLGGGAIFFALRPGRAVLSDINADLINTYRQVKRHPAQLVNRLRRLPADRATYGRQRGQKRRSAVAKAVRFLYLNRTAFGGMYRLNRYGGFNVPFGGGERTAAPLWRNGLLRSAASALRTATLRTEDFEEAMLPAGRGDLVYCDPTYTVAHNNNGFVRYNERNFSWEDQKRLARCCRAAARRGAIVLVSNACHKEILSLFDPPVHGVVTRPSSLCPDGARRRRVKEYLLLYPPAALPKIGSGAPR